MTEKNYRLIWFHHFHKAAGSTMFASAMLNGEIPYPNHQNGNPCDSAGRVIPLWEFGADEIGAFVDHCEANGITFVCTEWGCPDLRLLREDPRVITVSIIRDPFERLVSNYEYDILRGYERICRLPDYYFHHSLGYRQPDYYTRALARGAGVSKTISDVADLAATENFAAFDYVLVLGHTKGFTDMHALLGWPQFAPRTNVKRTLVKSLLRHTIRLEPERLRANYLIAKRYRHDYPEFQGVFNAANVRDLALFERAAASARKNMAT
ncbi:hypothetical protein [Pseudophaeobacter sp.]|uniref:hypothetical protein n=1 Tax=Pseudophaeobacter sp. TaxID=1971739 RepID=UPI003299414C